MALPELRNFNAKPAKAIWEIYSLYCFLTTTHNFQFLQNWASYHGYGNSWLAIEVQPQFCQDQELLLWQSGVWLLGLCMATYPPSPFSGQGVSPHTPRLVQELAAPAVPLLSVCGLCLLTGFFSCSGKEAEVCPLSQTPSSPSLPSLPRNRFL